MVMCLEQGAELHMAQLTPLPLTVSCFSKIQIRFTFLVPAHLGSPRERAVKRMCVYVLVCLLALLALYACIVVYATVGHLSVCLIRPTHAASAGLLL